jgi:hypothetical protein
MIMPGHVRTRITAGHELKAYFWNATGICCRPSFATVLGMTPPADAADWIEVGTDLLAYRATYKITDPVVALGREPDPNASRRWSWHFRLTNQFRNYH